MEIFRQYFLLSAPLFIIVFAGYAVSSARFWRRQWTAIGSKLVFAVALPALLFHMMSRLHELPPVDWRLLVAFFGGCFITFLFGRFIAARYFQMNGVEQSVFALGGVFSNNALLGLPLAKLTLGEAAVPAVALVLVFNALTLWLLVSLSVEWARHGSFDRKGLMKTAANVITNPLVASIVAGTLVSLAGIRFPPLVDTTLEWMSHAAAPAALIVLGMSLSEYGLRRDIEQSAAICAIKLVAQPLVVWLLAIALGLPDLERSVVVLLASIAVGANVYLMSVQFQVLQSVIPSSIVLSTLLAAVTTPTLLALMKALE